MDNNCVVEEALPRFLKGDNGKAVLIVHGYSGFPGEFYELASILNSEGYTVSLPRLPGHGTNRLDFLSSSWSDWLNHIKNSYAELEAEFESVSIVGLSMGGVLSLILSSYFNPERLVLLAPAMEVNNSLFKYTPILKYFIKDIPKEWIPAEGDSEGIKKLGVEYWSYTSPGQLAQMHKLIKISKKGLKNITCKTLLILSENDESVPLKSGDVIRKGLKNCNLQEIILKESSHVLVTGVEKDVVYSHVSNFLKQSVK